MFCSSCVFKDCNCFSSWVLRAASMAAPRESSAAEEAGGPKRISESIASKKAQLTRKTVRAKMTIVSPPTPITYLTRERDRGLGGGPKNGQNPRHYGARKIYR